MGAEGNASMFVKQFVYEGLGNTTHLVGAQETGVAAVVDPQRDVDLYVDAARSLGVRISHIFETHIHNDFVTGSRELAALTGARIGASAEGGLEFEHLPLREGDEVAVGSVKFRVLATPGHTPEHVSYLAWDADTPERPAALFSGGSLLVGSVSRTDLLGHEHAAGLARDLYRSLHEKILVLPDEVAVYPTHGAGSFCTAAPGAERSTTIGRERRQNPLLRMPSVERFVAEVLRIMPSYPTYFKHMRALNRRGPRVLARLPELAPLSPQDVLSRQRQGEAVVDVRPAVEYVAGHIPGVYQVALRPAFASWVGWVVPFGTPVVVVSSGTEVHEEVVRQLIRVGYDDLSGYLAGGMAAWERAGLPVARFGVVNVEELRQRLRRGEPLVVLDVRQDAEWEAGHVPGAIHVEGGRLAEQGLTLPKDRPIATHCGHEERSATGLSILERLGFRDLLLVRGGWEAWERAGLPVERPPRGKAGVAGAERPEQRPRARRRS